MAQACMVLRCDDPDLYEVRRNSEWHVPGTHAARTRHSYARNDLPCPARL
jgi:hypothetical protein